MFDMKGRIISILLRCFNSLSLIKYEFDDIPEMTEDIESDLNEITDIINEIKNDYMIVDKKKIN